MTSRADLANLLAAESTAEQAANQGRAIGAFIANLRNHSGIEDEDNLTYLAAKWMRLGTDDTDEDTE